MLIVDLYFHLMHLARRLGASFNNGNWDSSIQIMRNRMGTQVLRSQRINTGHLDPTVVRYSSIIANTVQDMFYV